MNNCCMHWGYYIWYNKLQRKWLVQDGYIIVAGYTGIAQAKAWATREYKKHGART